MSTSVYAAETLNIDQVVDLGIEASDNLEDLSEAVEDLEKEYNRALARGINFEKQVNEIRGFQMLHSLKLSDVDFTDEQEDEYDDYQRSYGPVPPRLPRQQWVQMNLLGKYLPEQLQIAYKDLQVQYEKAEAGTAYQGKKLYNNLVYLEELLVLQEEYLRILEKQYSNAKEKINLGMISELELLEAKVDYENQVLSVENLEYSIAAIQMQINQFIDYDLLAEWETRSTLKTNDLAIESPELAVEAAMNASRGLALAKEKDALMQDKADFFDGLGNETIEEILDAKVEASEASYDLIDKEKTVEVSAYNQYMTVENARENLEETKDQYYESIENLKSGRLNFEAGYIDQNTYDLIAFQHDLQRVNLKRALRTLGEEASYFKLLLEQGLF